MQVDDQSKEDETKMGDDITAEIKEDNISSDKKIK
jgi:hypothetical protein